MDKAPIFVHAKREDIIKNFEREEEQELLKECNYIKYIIHRKFMGDPQYYRSKNILK